MNTKCVSAEERRRTRNPPPDPMAQWARSCDPLAIAPHSPIFRATPPRHPIVPSHTMTVISIQSQVAFGHVGNSAAVFPLQMHGIDVVAVPTTLLSNRPGYPTIRGRVLDAKLVADLLLGIEERGAIDSASMILSGYLGSPDIAAVVADFVARGKGRNPALRYACDPAFGD